MIKATQKDLDLVATTSPRDDGRVPRSYINYHSGIPELDEFLKDKNLYELRCEFGIQIHRKAVNLYIYRGNDTFFSFLLKKESVIAIKSLHEQKLNIRKDPKASGEILGAIGAMGILGAVVAGTVDVLTTSDKNVPENEIVLGSIFEIIVQSENDEVEKIVVSCTDKRKVAVESFLNMMLDKKNSKNCYVATACYGNIDSQEVIKFREFRDKKLHKSVPGRIFINIYYLISPRLSIFLRKRQNINRFVKIYILDKLYEYLNTKESTNR